MYRNFYSYSDMPKMIQPDIPKKTAAAPSSVKPSQNLPALTENGKLFGKFELDDVILITVALLLFADDCDDTLLMLAIAFVFISGII